MAGCAISPGCCDEHGGRGAPARAGRGAARRTLRGPVHRHLRRSARRRRVAYIAISDGSTSDWSHKTGRGREHRLSIAIWDDGATPARLHALLGQAQDAIEAMPRALDGHAIASLVFLRGRVVRDPDGPWAGRLDYRIRTLEI